MGLGNKDATLMVTSGRLCPVPNSRPSAALGGPDHNAIQILPGLCGQTDHEVEFNTGPPGLEGPAQRL